MSGAAGQRMRDAARALIGTRFRLHGRDPATGLDCIGLVVAAAKGAGLPVADVPDDYRLRGHDPALCAKALLRNGWRRVEGAPRDGDIVVTSPGECQTHLMVRDGAAHIHAHAGLGRVVTMPATSDDCILQRWRFDKDENGREG